MDRHHGERVDSLSVIAATIPHLGPAHSDELEALIQEARLRQRRRRIRAAIGLLAFMALVGIGFGIDRSVTGAPSSGPAGRAGVSGLAGTKLTVVALNSWVGRAVFHIDCNPAGGDIPSPARACFALARTPQLVTSPTPFTCFGGTSSWWDVAISGRFHGKKIRRTFSTCWTPQMTTIGRLRLGWTVLQRHLVARRVQAVMPGTSTVFRPGELRAADLVTCTILGHRLQLGVPIDVGPTSSTGFGGANGTTVTLSAARRRDGSVAAGCRSGGP
jgi:hypothetical protein